MKTKKFYITAIAMIFIACSVCSCMRLSEESKKNSVMTEKTYDIKDLKTLKITGNVKLAFVKGNKSYIKVSGRKGEVDGMVVDQDGSSVTLKEHKKGFLRISFGDDALKVYVCAPKIEEMKVTGNSSLSMDEPVKSKKFDLIVTGNSSADIKLRKVENSSIKITGNSSVSMKYDSCGYSKVDITGNSSISMNGTLKKTLNLKTAGNSDVSNSVRYFK